jgi:hypothetical protein
MKALIVSIFAVCVGLSASAAWAGPKPVSAATAKANGANSMTQSRCIALCKSMGGSSCDGNCKAGQCYYNDNSGNYYCVR